MVRRGCSRAANSENNFLLSTTGKCFVSRTLHYVRISLPLTSHFNAFFTV